MIACFREALELAPLSDIARIDLALKLVEYRGDTEESAMLIQSVDTSNLSETERAFHGWCQAWIALEEGHPTSALHLVNEASRRFRKHPAPLIVAALAELDALRCLALVAADQRQRASQCLEQIRARMEATNARLFERCATTVTDTGHYRG